MRRLLALLAFAPAFAFASGVNNPGISGVTAGGGLSGGGTSGTITVAVDPSSGTLQGNTFNAANKLIRADTNNAISVASATIPLMYVSSITTNAGTSIYASTGVWPNADGVPRPGQWFIDGKGRLGIGTYPDNANVNEWVDIAASTTVSAFPSNSSLDLTVWNQGDATPRLVLYAGHGLNDGTRNAVTYLVTGSLGWTTDTWWTNGPLIRDTSNWEAQNLENMSIFNLNGSTIWFDGLTSTTTYKFMAGSTIISTITASGSTFPGTNIANNAPSGDYGEYLSSSTPSTPGAATNTWGVMASITLTPGDWDVSYLCDAFNVTFTQMVCGIGKTTGSDPTGIGLGNEMISQGTFSEQSMSLGAYRVSIATTTTYYGKVMATYSAGSLLLDGIIRARRVR